MGNSKEGQRKAARRCPIAHTVTVRSPALEGVTVPVRPGDMIVIRTEAPSADVFLPNEKLFGREEKVVSMKADSEETFTIHPKAKPGIYRAAISIHQRRAGTKGVSEPWDEQNQMAVVCCQVQGTLYVCTACAATGSQCIISELGNPGEACSRCQPHTYSQHRPI